MGQFHFMTEPTITARRAPFAREGSSHPNAGPPFHPRRPSSGFRNDQPRTCRGHRALAKVPDQDHVARPCPLGERELTAIAREVEPEDLVGLEVGQLYRLPAVQWQRPDVGDAVDCIYEGQCASVWRPAQTGGTVDAGRNVEHLDRVAAREGDDGDLKGRVRLILAVEAGDQAAVGRDRRI